MEDFWRLETSMVHAGYGPEAHQRAVALPIYQTAAFAFDDSAHAADLFDHKIDGYVYTRLGNPTGQVLADRVAALEQGVGGAVTGSGQAAVACALMAIAEAGDNVVAASSLYGTTYHLLAQTLPQYGISVRLCDYNRPDQFRQAIDSRTKAVYCETLANPSGHVADLAALAELAHAAGLPLVVDNTLATPYLCRPFEHGADVVVHSLTKYMAGHGIALGGAIVDSGRFPWAAHGDRFARLTRAEHGVRGQSFVDAHGAQAFAARCVNGPLRTMGAVLAPLNAFLILQGIETLALRMDRICFNAGLIAQFLSEHPAVAWVSYPGLPAHPDHGACQRYMGGRASGVLSFGVRGGRQAGADFQDRLRLVRRSTNLGDCKTLVCHPASTTHRQLSAEDLRKSGTPEDLVRLSVGIEHIEDLLGDIDQALAAR
ncbi:O-acetylhomoserine aminocarboxypropyltransferase/cysteine synthase family protein [Ramlibacter humi]|uniref:O-acetylhomoserine aminocarboxypropyltransferase/cysteine synthase n=1 Tax=Ramlibacter humi TaxID=2530451 RepID=A0A4Z0BFH0_9BURK|nr:O-acetylhomoserine aminocarboxypropyltransferase/cysteine synthase family protein [Ramlibacter humi]TFY97057.1 O-acetylhomoserine aminocarboxypropyltransferase/cysteine synthase [Ramlibacter humi]